MKNFKYYFLLLAVTIIGGMSSCTNHDFEPMSQAEIDKAKYDYAFLTYVGGTIAPTQDWGFGVTTTNGMTRAVMTDTWGGAHTCSVSNWENILTFETPQDAVDLTRTDLFPDGNNLGSDFQNVENWYIPANFSGSLSLHNMNLKGNVYVLGTLTDLQQVNYNGTVTFYIAKNAAMTYSVQSGNRHTVVNAGTLTVTSFNNIGLIYNGGSLTLGTEWSVDIPNAMTIYSNGEGTIEMPRGGDLKAVCDIHGTLNVNGNVKIQNSTKKYICGIVATGTVENVDGPLETSYVQSNLFKFDGNPIYLLPGGHVNVTTLQVPNSNSKFYGAAGSTGLVEAVNYEFGNKNDFTHTFSNNIYFKVSGYVKVDNCYAMGQSHYFNNVADYLADTTHSDEFALAASRINAGNASGYPACGSSWTIGEPDTESKVENLIASGRVFCEDLGQVTREDIDFNDVVFDAYIYEVKFYRNNNLESTDTICKITLLAAGGTLPLTVAGKEVHDCFGEGTGTIINTIVNEEGSYGNSWVTKSPIDLGTFNYSKIIDIPIVVLYGNSTVQELEAAMGKVPRKICVPIGTPWAKERNKLKDAYPGFQEYVNNSTPGIWSNRVGTYLYPSGN